MTTQLAGTDLAALVARLDLPAKVALLTGADFWSLPPEPAVGLRRLVMSDGPAGVRGEAWDERSPSANVPSPTALAATWDAERVERIGGLLAAEARRKGVDVLLAPTVNLHRSPYGGRHFECLSEDPLLTGRIGAAFVRGLQAGGVAATVKHFVANDSETERFTADVRMDTRTLRELYLAPFEHIVREGGAWAVMAAYNAVDGVTMTENALLRDVLKDEWGFDGPVVSDWFAARSLAAAGPGLLDVVMPGPGGPWGEALVAAVRAGEVPESAVDDKVRRVLLLAARVGALAGVPGPAAPPAWTPDGVAAELRAAAAASFVLARNAPAAGSPVLPLPAGLRRVAVLGPNAAEARTLGGGSATVFPPYTVSPLAGLRAALGAGVTVTHARGGRTTRRLAAADLAWLRTPDGDPGVRLRFLAADGAVLGGEDRAAAGYRWNGAFRPGVPVRAVATVELAARLRVDRDGTYRVGGSGVGRFRLAVDGTPVLDERAALPPEADPVEGIMRPPQVAGRVALRAGQEVELLLLHEPAQAPGHGDTDEGNVTLQLVADRESDDDAELAEAVALAAEADVAVVVVGTTEEVESEGFDRDALGLPGRQDDLVRRVAAANARTVVVVNAGAPVLLPWADEVPAVLLAWFPGQEFGHALADVLLGAAEPGGRLPTTWPADERDLPDPAPVDGVLRYGEGLAVGHRAAPAARYAFGHGLGYTRWEYRRATARRSAGGDITVTVEVRNAGDRRGREVVQVYAARPDSAVPRPRRWLAGYAAVAVDAGATATVEVTVPARSLQHWTDAGWVTEPGPFRLEVGRSSADLPLAVDVG